MVGGIDGDMTSQDSGNKQKGALGVLPLCDLKKSILTLMADRESEQPGVESMGACDRIGKSVHAILPYGLASNYDEVLR